ncbi:MAG: glucose-1-phosphate adenylyltransferase, partial [Clostridia bacterium]|nr:glucose-1-phosphate adenylyltransferase [Clostridia bacterium]
VEDSVIMPNTVIRKGAAVKYAILSENVEIDKNARIGDKPEYYSKSEWGIAVIGKGNIVAANTVVKPKEII